MGFWELVLIIFLATAVLPVVAWLLFMLVVFIFAFIVELFGPS